MQHPEGQKRAEAPSRHPNWTKRDGRTQRIELIWEPVGRRYWVRRDGKYSIEVPEATASQVAERIRRWLVANT